MKNIDEILQKYPVYNKLYTDNVIMICGDVERGKTICIGEMCDCYFTSDVNSEELQQLSRMFTELARFLRGDIE